MKSCANSHFNPARVPRLDFYFKTREPSSVRKSMRRTQTWHPDLAPSRPRLPPRPEGRAPASTAARLAPAPAGRGDVVPARLCPPPRLSPPLGGQAVFPDRARLPEPLRLWAEGRSRGEPGVPAGDRETERERGRRPGGRDGEGRDRGGGAWMALGAGTAHSWDQGPVRTAGRCQAGLPSASRPAGPPPAHLSLGPPSSSFLVSRLGPGGEPPLPALCPHCGQAQEKGPRPARPVFRPGDPWGPFVGPRVPPAAHTPGGPPAGREQDEAPEPHRRDLSAFP